MRAPPDTSPRLLIEVAVGFVIWSIGFVALYGINHIGCAFLWPELIQRGVLVGLTLLHLLALVILALWLRRRMRAVLEPESLRYGLTALSAGTAAAAVGSALIGFIPPLFVSFCQ